MVSKRESTKVRRPKRAKTLPAKSVTGSQARRVKGGAVPTDQFRHPGSQGTGLD